MEYNVIVSPRAQQEIDDAIAYYSENSYLAPERFINSLEAAYQRLRKDPFLAIKYKNVRAIQFKRFPYVLYFSINEKANTVRVLSCFHIKRDPERRP